MTMSNLKSAVWENIIRVQELECEDTSIPDVKPGVRNIHSWCQTWRARTAILGVKPAVWRKRMSNSETPLSESILKVRNMSDLMSSLEEKHGAKPETSVSGAKPRVWGNDSGGFFERLRVWGNRILGKRRFMVPNLQCEETLVSSGCTNACFGGQAANKQSLAASAKLRAWTNIIVKECGELGVCMSLLRVPTLQSKELLPYVYENEQPIQSNTRNGPSIFFHPSVTCHSSKSGASSSELPGR